MTVFHDEQVGRYVLYLAVFPRPDPGVFVVRLESDDPYEWPHPVYDVGATPAWKGFEKVARAAVLALLDADGLDLPVDAHRDRRHREWVMRSSWLDTAATPREGVSAQGFSHDRAELRGGGTVAHPGQAGVGRIGHIRLDRGGRAIPRNSEEA